MKTTFKTTILAAILLVSVTASSQEKPLTFGVKGGLNLSNVGGDASNTDSKVGFNIGVTLDKSIAENVYLLTGLEVTTKGFKADTNLGKVSMNPIYLQLPVHIGYKLPVSETAKIVFRAGPYVAYGIGGKAKLGSESENVFSSGGFKEFDFGLGGAAGVEFGKFGVNLGYDFGVTNMIEGSEGKLKNQNAYLTLGYRF